VVRTLLCLAAILVAPLMSAQSVSPSARPSPQAAAAELSVVDAVILGTVEGVTEYLPISSTGHLIVATHALNLDSDTPLHGPNNSELWYKKPSTKDPQGVPLTLKLAADTYTVIIQFGAIAAVAILYWRQLLSMLRGLIGQDPAGLVLLRNILIAFLPAAVVGLALHHWIEEHLFSIGTVIAAQVIGAVLIFWAESYRKRRIKPSADETVAAPLTIKQALDIGVLQCAALWPGMSRSMMTIVGGYFGGLSPRRSAEFSFLLGFVTLSAATVFKGYKSGGAMIAVFGWSHVLLGCAVAAVTAAVAVKFLVGWLSRHGMIAFAYYRLAFAALLAAVTWL
jgi:undecaprenyl-diphosphatase